MKNGMPPRNAHNGFYIELLLYAQTNHYYTHHPNSLTVKLIFFAATYMLFMPRRLSTA
jgi:hypothetical protein